MIHHTTYECRKCGLEIEVEVVVNEEDDLPSHCPDCGQPTDGADLQADAMGALTDRAHERAKE